MKILHLLLVIAILFVFSCNNISQKKQKEVYNELVKQYPSRFANGNAVTIYNANKEYILRSCNNEQGFGIEIIDLSKLDIEQKIIQLKGYLHENIGSGAQYEWMNAYIHEAIDNYQQYGEEFLLIVPLGGVPKQPKRD